MNAPTQVELQDAAIGIDDIEDAESADFQIKLPQQFGGAVVGIFTIAGPQHPKRKQAQFAKLRRARDAYAKTGKFSPIDPVEEEQDLTDAAVAAVLGWTLVSAGKHVPFDRETARRWISSKDWLRRQVLKAMEDEDRFTVRSGSA